LDRDFVFISDATKGVSALSTLDLARAVPCGDFLKNQADGGVRAHRTPFNVPQ
jgi:hypothetical protein